MVVVHYCNMFPCAFIKIILMHADYYYYIFFFYGKIAHLYLGAMHSLSLL